MSQEQISRGIAQTRSLLFDGFFLPAPEHRSSIGRSNTFFIGAFTYTHLRILPFPAIHVFASLSSRWNWRKAHSIKTGWKSNRRLTSCGRFVSALGMEWSERIRDV